MTPNVQYIPAAVTGADDTFEAATVTWSTNNTWYSNWVSGGGTWSSTGTTDGDFVLVDNGSQVDNNRIRVEAASNDVQVNDFMDCSLNGGTVKRATYNGNTAGNGDFFFEWDDGSLTNAQIEPGGTLGWAANDLVLEYYRP